MYNVLLNLRCVRKAAARHEAGWLPAAMRKLSALQRGEQRMREGEKCPILSLLICPG